MNILLIGSGGREHALAWKIAQSPLTPALFIAPGNPGTATLGTNVALNPDDRAAVATFCDHQGIDLVVIGPEGPLVGGLADHLRAAGVAVFGPDAAAARLEGSKSFTKALCDEAGIPTAAHASFDRATDAHAHLDRMGAPIVVKADGLAAGKGVTVAETVDEARAAIDAIFTEPGARLVLEEKLTGIEASFFALVDGETALPLATAQDHKRAFDGDKGPNTGGMGAFSPSPLMTQARINQVMDEIITPTVATMKARGTPFRGVLYAGLMIDGPHMGLIEYNVRFGDPEAQVLMLRWDGDMVPALYAAATGALAHLETPPRWSPQAAVTVVMAAQGYPGAYDKGEPIHGLDAAAQTGARIFQAGTAMDGGTLVSAGGRVLNVSALGDTLDAARQTAYEAVDRIEWPGGFCRQDIAALAAPDAE
ncbi:phosphoribosylamine--glycine ligase [Yunchengibacter salinarum]|uniref:phosphoribosylamine--glycine ligase n=1 Tax=Yunchengibacter salinarum TaxID=3133399 RepID=UPI0035B5913F